MVTSFWDLSVVAAETPAIVTAGGDSLSYGGLAQQADQWCAQLQDAAAGKRMMVALEFATTPECIAAYIGALRSGLPLLLAEPGQITPDSRLAQIWQPELRLRTTPEGLTLEQHPYEGETPPAPHGDLTLLLSTSGSTGDPKLVRLSGENIDSNAQSIAEYLKLTPQDCAATTLPLYYSYGMSVLNSYLAVGATLFLTDRSVTEDAFWSEATTAKVTSLALVPHQFDLLEQAHIITPNQDAKILPSLRYITQAGGKLAGRQVRHFNEIAHAQDWELVVMYGQTEAAPRISYVPSEALAHASDTIGCPVPGGRIWLADEEGAPIEGSGQQGELVYEGPNVMMGYGESRPDLARGAEHKDLRTGDIAERTEDGFFRITGRLKRFVKLYGLRLSLDQIEAELRHHEIAAYAVAVDDHLVLLHVDANQGEAAALAVADAYELPADGICCSHLEELPLLSSGKPDQRALREIAGAALASHLDSTARNRASERPSVLILRLTRSGDADLSRSFLDLGGNSLSYLEVQMALEQRLGAVPEGWEEMSLQQLDTLPPVAGGSRKISRVGIDVILRLVAISFVVAQHASDYPLYGGTWILIVLMGFSAARFQHRLISGGQALKLGAAMLYPILPLYFAILLAYGALRDVVPLSFATLVGNYYIFPDSKLLTVYWFISLYAQLVLVLLVLTVIPSTRAYLTKKPWHCFAAIGTIASLAGLALILQDGYVYAGERVSHVADFPVTHITGRSLLETLPIFALGWMIATMKSRAQIGATMLLAALVLYNFSSLWIGFEASIYLTIALALLTTDLKVPMPTALGRWVQLLASVTLFVYLLHQVMVTVFRYWLDLEDHFAVPLSLIFAFALGMGAKWTFDTGERLVQKIALRKGENKRLA